MTAAAVGLFEAKTHLSEYVARAEKGEEVIIMRHNKPVAKIVPLHAKGDPAREAQVLNAIFPIMKKNRAATQAIFEIIKNQPGY